MTGLTGALLVGAVAAAVLDWVAVARALRPLELVCKPLALALLVVVALALDPADAAQRAWFVVALLASLAGDVFLMLPAAKGRQAAQSVQAVPPAFVAGLVAFLLAHSAYVVGFVVGGVTALGLAAGAVVVLLGGATAGVSILRGAAARAERVVVGALATYLLVIGAMVVTAYGSARPLALAGATLFFASDALIGWDRFVRPLAWAPVVIIVSYHLGQIGLVLSLLG